MNSSIKRKHVIQVRVAVEPELIPGTLGVMREHVLDENAESTTGHHAPIHTLGHT